jgi:hypothetical protein
MNGGLTVMNVRAFPARCAKNVCKPEYSADNSLAFP